VSVKSPAGGTGVTLAELRTEAGRMLATAPEGTPLDERVMALLKLALASSVTVLDAKAMEGSMRDALAAGATATQLHEVLALVSGLGVHTLMVGSPLLARVLQESGDTTIAAPRDSARTALWQAKVGDDPFWAHMEREVPGFLDNLLRLSPPAFEAFFQYCAVPWATRSVRAVHKELIAMAVDATPSHRFLPGFRLHLGNALALGAGRREVESVLDLAAAAPDHQGTR
jgi:alkylhydroperoxidase/carboxymuconolactone decarboxylase family protein YurZ